MCGCSLSNCIAQCNCTRPRLVFALTQCFKLIVIVQTTQGNTVLPAHHKEVHTKMYNQSTECLKITISGHCNEYKTEREKVENDL